MILRKIAGLLSPRGPRARLSILIFHRVLSQPDSLFPGEPDVRRFEEILSWIARWFQVLPLDEAVERLRVGDLPERALAITFDDGYADNATNALPILKHYSMPATFFVATSFLDGGRMWNDSVIEAVRGFRRNVLDLNDVGLGTYAVESDGQRRLAIAALLGKVKYLDSPSRRESVDAIVDIAGGGVRDDLMMRSEQVIELKKSGMQIGAHTGSHPILERIPDPQARLEIGSSRTVLESLLNEPVTLFAYPNGKPGVDYSMKHVTMVRESGFVAAVSTAVGVSTQASDVYQLPRFTPWDRTRWRYGLRLLANLRSNGPCIVRDSS